MLSDRTQRLIEHGRRQQRIFVEEAFPTPRAQGSDVGGGGQSTALKQGIVVAHGDPDPIDNRIYAHKVRPLIFAADHKTPPVYDGRDPTSQPPPDPPVVEFLVSPFEPGGWFHVGQVIEFQEATAAIYKAHCAQFLGSVTKVRYVDGVDPALDPRDTVEVTPFDGDLSQPASNLVLYDGTDPANGIGDGRVAQALMFPGAGLAVDDPVLCIYTGQRGRPWLAVTMIDIVGDTTAADFAFREPTGQGNVCTVSDPELPVTAPTSDDLDDAAPDIQAQ